MPSKLDLTRLSPEALLLEPREFFDAALIGITDTPDDHWPRQSKVTVAVYDTALCIEAIQQWLEDDYESACAWFDTNTAGGWYGEGTPTFSTFDEDNEESVPPTGRPVGSLSTL